MSRTIFARGAALAAVTVLALTACGGADDSEADREPTGQEQGREADDGAAEEDADGAAAADEAEADDSDGAGEAEAPGSSGEGAAGTDTEEGAAAEDTSEDASEAPAVVEIGTEFTDEETGDVITIVSAVRGNPTEYYAAADNPDGEMIYLEVSVSPGDSYGGVISQSDFLLDDGGEEVNYAASADDELTAAGFEYFEGAPRRDGGATGYIPIYVETTGDTLTGAYVRPEMEVLGEDTTVPEFRGEFEIPAA